MHYEIETTTHFARLGRSLFDGSSTIASTVLLPLRVRVDISTGRPIVALPPRERAEVVGPLLPEGPLAIGPISSWTSGTGCSEGLGVPAMGKGLLWCVEFEETSASELLGAPPSAAGLAPRSAGQGSDGRVAGDGLAVSLSLSGALEASVLVVPTSAMSVASSCGSSGMRRDACQGPSADTNVEPLPMISPP